jgi:hypothetical protein
MKKRFAIAIAVPMLLGSATAGFANEVVQVNTVQQVKKVNTGTHVNIPISTGAFFGGTSDADRRGKPRPPGPGGTDELQLQPRINLNIDTRVRPKPRGPGGTEALQQINSINQLQH